MDLENLNPAVFEMWKRRAESGDKDYFQPSTQEDVADIEAMVGHKLPDDYVEFLIRYSTVGAIPSIAANYFPIAVNEKRAITSDFSLVPWARLTIGAIKAYQQPHPDYKGIRGRLPDEVLPLTSDNNKTLLIDLRQTSFGNVLYIRHVRNQVFGTGTYGWNHMWYVAPTFTDFLQELGTEEELKLRYPNRKVI